MLFMGLTTCQQPDESLDSHFRVLLAVIGALLLLFLVVVEEKVNQSAILFVGVAGSGKTVLTWGLLKYLGEAYPNFRHGSDSDNRILAQDVEAKLASGDEVEGTAADTSNKISFSIDPSSKEEFVIYDFGGEQIAQSSPVSRVRRTSEMFTSMSLDINDIQSYEEKEYEAFKMQKHLIIDRRNIKHVVFLIHPEDNGDYPNKDVMLTLQSNIQLVEELTMRTSQPLHSSEYSTEVKKYLPQAHRIRIHCLFTKYTHRDVDEMNKEQSEELLKDISTDLNRLVNQSNGTRQFVNVLTESGGRYEKDFYLVKKFGQTLMR